jgi:hypothetical protein
MWTMHSIHSLYYTIDLSFVQEKVWVRNFTGTELSSHAIMILSMNRKERFLKVYANLPINLRNEIIYVLPDDRPLTWNAVFIEVKNDTELGKQIGEKLDSLGII